MKRYSSSLFLKASRLLPSHAVTVFVSTLAVAFFWTQPALAGCILDGIICAGAGVGGGGGGGSGSVSTLGAMLCSLQTNGMGPIPDLFSAIAYIAGAFMIGNGFLELVRHHDNPREKPFHHPVLKISAGGALMAAPHVTATLIRTFYTTPASGGIRSCNAGAVTSTSGGVGLDVLITNLVGNIYGPMVSALSALAVIIGLFMIVRGLIKAGKYNVDPRSHSITHIVANLSVGALLVVVGQSMDMMLSTIFGGLTQSSMEGSSVVNNWYFVTQLGLDNTQFSTAVGAALNFFQLIGLIAFIRGWLILKNASEGSGQATLAQGITHILGGTLALNIFNFLEIMDKTFGTGFL